MSKFNFCTLLIIGAIVSGCSSTAATTASSSGTASTTGLTISPTSVSLTEGEAYSFSTSGGSGSYTYSVMPDGTTSTGTVTSAGYYVAPSGWTGTTYLIVADTEGNQNYATVTVTSSSSGTSTGTTGSNIQLSPSSITVAEGGTVSFAASGGYGSYTYTIDGGTGSINSSTGLYTAASGATGTTYILVTDSDGDQAIATVTITSSSSGSTSGTVYSLTGTLQNCTGVTGGKGNTNNWQVNTGLLRTINDSNNYTESPVHCTGLSIAGQIPSTATITGVTASVYMINQSNKTDGSLLQTLNLINASEPVGTTKSLGLLIPGNTATTFPTFSEGGSADAWGATLSPTIVNSSTFGINIQTYRGNDRLFTGDESGNLPQVTIYYTL
jgi:hypothetical protein